MSLTIDTTNCLTDQELEIRTNQSDDVVYLKDLHMAMSGGYRAVQNEIGQALRLYEQERLACGCVDCLKEIGLSGLKHS